MKNISISVVVDSLVTGLIVFLISSVCLNGLLSRTQTLIFSILISLIFIFLAFYVLAKKFGQNYLKKEEQINKTNILNQLVFNSAQQNDTLFEKAFANLNINTKKVSGNIFLPEKNSLIYLCFTFDDVKKADVLKAYNKINTDEKVYILALDFTAEIKDFAEKFGKQIILYNGDSIYEFLKTANEYPKITMILKQPKSKFKESIKAIFTKKRAKNYLCFGLTFLFFSFFTPYKLYYVIFGCVLCVLAVLTLFFSKKSIKASFN